VPLQVAHAHRDHGRRAGLGGAHVDRELVRRDRSGRGNGTQRERERHRGHRQSTVIDPSSRRM
jgi:hypothetical protein